MLAAAALEAAPPSDQEVREVGCSMLLHVGRLEKKEKEAMAASRKASRAAEKKGGDDAVMALVLEELVAHTELWGGVYSGFNPGPRSGGKRARSLDGAGEAGAKAERPRTRKLVERGEAEPPSPVAPFAIHYDHDFKVEAGARSSGASFDRASWRTGYAAGKTTEKEEKERWDAAFDAGMEAALENGGQLLIDPFELKIMRLTEELRTRPTVEDGHAFDEREADHLDVINFRPLSPSTKAARVK